ncbi:MAG: GtrA family protein [Alphaproteobacteria bacterium]|nr:GtrA family protein [Alphaproteobacteria bacterium]
MRRTDVRVQFAWYLVVGGGAFAVELASFVGLLAAGLAPIPASIASFVLATAANYLLSNLLAFERSAMARTTEIVRFVLVAGIGLGLNTGFVWLFLLAGLPAVAAKVIAVAPVLAWNFLGRRLFVFSRAVPAATWDITSRLVTSRRPVPLGDAEADPAPR